MPKYIKDLLRVGRLFVGLPIFALATQECDMHIEKVQHDAETYTLTLKHDKNCEVMMDEQPSKIVLVSKKMEGKVSQPVSKESNSSNTEVDKLLTLAQSKLGDSYVYAATGPDHFDCSGFVYYVFKKNGMPIPRTSLLQSQSGTKQTRETLKKGDILFFDTHDRKHINHSGIYLGNGKFIHSSSGKAYAVTISELDKGFYKDKFRWGIRKISSQTK